MAAAAAGALAGCGFAASIAPTAPATPYEVTASNSQAIVLTPEGLHGHGAPSATPSALGATSSRVALADLGGSGRQQATITVSHRCASTRVSCRWLGEASQYPQRRAIDGSSAVCPVRFDVRRSIWIGRIHRGAGTERATATFKPPAGFAAVRVCVYADDRSPSGGWVRGMQEYGGDRLSR
jgi:hypothetical protein